MLNRKWLPLFLQQTRTKKCDRMAAAPPPHVKFRMDFSLSPFLSFDIDIPPHLSRIGLFLPALLFPSDSRLLAAAQRICCWRPHGELTRDQLGRSSLLPACLPTCATTLHSALTCQCCRCQCQRSTRSKLLNIQIALKGPGPCDLTPVSPTDLHFVWRRPYIV